MAQSGKLIRVSSTDGVHFTEAIAQNAGEQENLILPGYDVPIQVNAATAPPTFRDLGTLRGLIIQSLVQRQWEIYLFGSRDAQSADPNEETFINSFRFSAASGRQIGAAGLFRYSLSGLSEAIVDDDNTASLHVVLVPRDGAKTAYGAGELFRLTLTIEPTIGYN